MSKAAEISCQRTGGPLNSLLFLTKFLTLGNHPCSFLLNITSNRRYLSEVTIADALRERLGKSQVVVQEKPHSSADRNQYQQEIVLNIEGGNKSTLKRHRSEKLLKIYSSEQEKVIEVEYESDDDIGVLVNKINIKRRKTDGLRLGSASCKQEQEQVFCPSSRNPYRKTGQDEKIPKIIQEYRTGFFLQEQDL